MAYTEYVTPSQYQHSRSIYSEPLKGLLSINQAHLLVGLRHSQQMLFEKFRAPVK